MNVYVARIILVALTLFATIEYFLMSISERRNSVTSLVGMIGSVVFFFILIYLLQV